MTTDPLALDVLHRTAERVTRIRDQLHQRRELTRTDLRWLAEVAQAAVLTLVRQEEERAEDDDQTIRDGDQSLESVHLPTLPG